MNHHLSGTSAIAQGGMGVQQLILEVCSLVEASPGPQAPR